MAYKNVLTEVCEGASLGLPALAKMYFVFYNSLRESGFTPEQAFELTKIFVQELNPPVMS